MNEANAKQVNGTHYSSEYQHWDLVAGLELGYFQGQITKYLSRWKKKNGMQDLEKALHFLEKAAEVQATEHRVISQEVGKFAEVNGLCSAEHAVLSYVAHGDLSNATLALDRYINALRASSPGPSYVDQG